MSAVSTSDAHATAEFPRLSKILESRRELVRLLCDQYKAQLDGRPLWLVSGSGPTTSYANVYERLIREIGFTRDVKIHSLTKDAETLRALAKETFSKWQKGDPIPGMIIYVGGQTTGDSTKAFLAYLRKCAKDEGKPEPRPIFGGIITALSNDGLFSDTASIFEGGVANSFKATAPNFIVGHLLTLLRQPFEMKASCVGDILSKISSLWDYEYSCKTLGTYHNDFAADLARSAYDRVLGRGDIHVTPPYLHTRRCLDDLFRAVQLCGLSMQLAGSSATCSGSEHLGWKWLEDFMSRRRKAMDKQGKDWKLTHGAGVLIMTIITLYMQGESRVADRVRQIASLIHLVEAFNQLHIPPTVIQVCLALGVGNRCKNYLAYLLDGSFPPIVGEVEERLTVLEQVELEVLPDTIRRAMIDSELAKESDFGRLHRDFADPLMEVLNKAVETKQGRPEAILYQRNFIDRLKALI